MKVLCLIFGMLLFIFETNGWKVTNIPLKINSTTVYFNDGDMTYIGGKDTLLIVNKTSHNVTMVDFQANAASVQACKQYVANECYNSIKLVQKVDNKTLLVCGTNAFDSSCYNLNLNTLLKTRRNLKEEEWLTNNPNVFVASTVTQNGSDTDLYVGSCVNSNCLLKRLLSTENLFTSGSIKAGTEFVNLYNSPKNGGVIYAFFREKSDAFVVDEFTAAGTSNTYAMVARACQRDEGGSYRFVGKWTTFMKLRLICPFPGGSNTGSKSAYYNYLRSVTVIENTVYGLFSLYSDWNIKNTALCSFKLADIDSYFNGAAFPGGQTLYYDASKATLQTMFEDGKQTYLPGQCPSSTQSTKTLVIAKYETFLQANDLIKAIIKPSLKKPLYVTNNLIFNDMTGIQLHDYHVIYLLNENGLLRKLVIPLLNNSVTVVSETTIFYGTQKITSFSATAEGLMVITNNKMLLLPFADCAIHTSCESCLSSPHCDWSLGCVDNHAPHLSRSCPAISMKPVDVHVNESNSGVVISWSNPPQKFTIDYYRINIMDLVDNSTAFTDQTAKTQIDIQLLQKGRRYFADVFAVRNNSSGPVVSVAFVLDLPVPILVEKKRSGKTYSIAISTVKGADTYNVSLYLRNSNAFIQNYIMHTNIDDKKIYALFYDLPEDNEYMATFVALSKHGVSSKTLTIMFTSEPITTHGAERTTMTIQFINKSKEQNTTQGAGSTSAVQSPVSTKPITTFRHQFSDIATTSANIKLRPTKALPVRDETTPEATNIVGYQIAFVVFLILLIGALVILIINLYTFRSEQEVTSSGDAGSVAEQDTSYKNGMTSMAL